MTVAGHFCSEHYSPGRLLGWVAVWNCAAALGLTMIYVLAMSLIMALFQGPLFMSIMMFFGFLIVAVVATVFLGGVLY